MGACIVGPQNSRTPLCVPRFRKVSEYLRSSHRLASERPRSTDTDRGLYLSLNDSERTSKDGLDVSGACVCVLLVVLLFRYPAEGTLGFIALPGSM